MEFRKGSRGGIEQIGMQDVTLDDNCYIMATLPSNDFEVLHRFCRAYGYQS